jgi:Lipoxygenase
VPQHAGVEAKQLYTFQKPGSDNYPPHLDIIPKVDQVDLLKIFDFMRLLDTGTLLGRVVPDKILDFIHDHPEGATIDKIVQRNNELHQKKEDIFAEENIGNRDDWYTDAVFAQQQFTGPNPTTIQHASADWIKRFAEVAQPNAQMHHLISSAAADSLYIQDCSYFRASVGVADQANMMSNDSTRFLCGAVTLFQLGDEGTLHPLAIVLDYKGKMLDSVVIFNKRLQPSDHTHDQRNDWPWRYAKTCAQVSDWIRHEVTVHLVNTHLVEEATIVATH